MAQRPAGGLALNVAEYNALNCAHVVATRGGGNIDGGGATLGFKLVGMVFLIFFEISKVDHLFQL